GSHPADMEKYAAELVALSPDVIFAAASPNVATLQRVGPRVPIVFADILYTGGAGFVASLARPGGTPPGFSAVE
ncbi:UNVERIFIED_CONTAM: ABC transporter substrate-binding protein, partial [Bacteroidetes bacterium 56_B9]